jgi:carbon monoxide dehydrogenase subunit G
MRIDNEFRVAVPIDQVWDILVDLEAVARCLPDAVLTGSDGEAFTGRAKVRVGPVVTEYVGTARLTAHDRSTLHAVVTTTGKEARGAGMSAAVISARLHADGEVTVVSLETDLTITGKVAQFGSTMIKEVAAKLLASFAANLEAAIEAAEGSCA